jgi:hypothetical protein
VNGADLGFRLRGQKRIEIVRGLAFLDLPDRSPVGPDAGEAGERTGSIEREPNVAALTISWRRVQYRLLKTPRVVLPESPFSLFRRLNGREHASDAA